MKPARKPEDAHKELLRRRNDMVVAASASLRLLQGLLNESLTPHEAKKRIAIHRGTMEHRFAEAIAALVIDVGALPPTGGPLGRAMPLEANTLHLLRDIGVAVEDALPVIDGRFDEAVARELGEHIERLVKGFKTLPTIGKTERRSSRMRETLSETLTTAKTRMEQEHDALAPFYLWLTLSKVASNTLWIVDYYTYIETGRWGGPSPT